VPMPTTDEKTNAVLLYSENILSVQGNGRIKSIERKAYKILRPGGRERGTISAMFDLETKITGMRGWCIPASGKDYEIKDKEAVEVGYGLISDAELVTDARLKMIRISAADPGNIVGYEIEQERRPYVLEDEWEFQDVDPAREVRYTLQLPAGWDYKAHFVNYAAVAATAIGNNQWQWVVNNVLPVKHEERMPPRRGVAGSMVLSFFPPGGSGQSGFLSWKEMGDWEAGLAKGRRTPSPDIKQKVVALTATTPAQLAKMQAIAKFVQSDVRYVAIELGIGGWQPHAATDIFTHRYGDCKDKATLTSSMLSEIGVESYYISINTTRGGAGPDRPAMVGWFNHAILAVKLPDGMNDQSLVATFDHPTLGKLLIFDPTDEYTPFGYLRGELQGNYGLLVAPLGGDLIRLPQLQSALNGIERKAKFTLSAAGVLSGEIEETRLGDSGMWQRMYQKGVKTDKDRVKPIETLVSNSFSTFTLTHAAVLNLNRSDMPFGYRYSLVAQQYAKSAGDLLLVRPRVVGSKAWDVLETKEPRKYPVEFEGPSRDTDTFEITLPAGYEVDDMPPPVDAEYSFASYHSKTEKNGNTLKYTRTYEVKELSVPVNKTDDLKKLYRIIASDERNTAVLKASAKP